MRQQTGDPVPGRWRQLLQAAVAVAGAVDVQQHVFFALSSSSAGGGPGPPEGVVEVQPAADAVQSGLRHEGGVVATGFKEAFDRVLHVETHVGSGDSFVRVRGQLPLPRAVLGLRGGDLDAYRLQGLSELTHQLLVLPIHSQVTELKAVASQRFQGVLLEGEELVLEARLYFQSVLLSQGLQLRFQQLSGAVQVRGVVRAVHVAKDVSNATMLTADPRPGGQGLNAGPQLVVGVGSGPCGQ